MEGGGSRRGNEERKRSRLGNEIKRKRWLWLMRGVRRELIGRGKKNKIEKNKDQTNRKREGGRGRGRREGGKEEGRERGRRGG